MTTSACRASPRSSSWPSDVDRSSVTVHLLRPSIFHHRPWPSFTCPCVRSGSPAGCSILTTSAPKSPSRVAAVGPANSVATSSTRMPFSGPWATTATDGTPQNGPVTEKDREQSGADLLVESLLASGIRTVFGLPGVQLDPAFDALARRADRIRVYHTRHEQATSYMADGYARASGEPGCCLVVPGPGLRNAMSVLATAHACASPVLCVAGQVPSDQIDSGRGLLHEIPHQLEMVRSVVKWSGRAMRPDELPGLVAEAVSQTRTGRPRPVAIEVPPDVLEALTDDTPTTVNPGGG